MDIETQLMNELAESGTDRARELFLQWQEERIKAKERFIEKLDAVNNCDFANVMTSLPSDPMVLAKYLHDNYEQITKITKWQTQKNCKVEFEDLPTENKNTMILLAVKLILDFVGNER